ncbi:MAG: S-layer protein [Firmicutes bacterium]|nr:S-layer protein [Bacillota bacterium]
MKRQTAMALAAVFAMSVAGTALAATANPFVDVPAKHWAYDSINKLAQAGAISGYGDGTYQGDKTLTRYEVATIVAKAMANSDKADAATQKEIEALKAEFGTELSNLGVRVDNLEKNASKVKFTGEVRERYEYIDNAKLSIGTNDQSENTSTTRLRLNMEAPIDNNVIFHGRFESESTFGNSDGNNTSKLTQAYISGNAIGLEYSFGRQPIWLGQGMIADITGDCDGLLVSGGKDVKVTLGAFKTTQTYIEWASALERNGNFQAANIDAKITDNLHVSLSYLKDQDGNYYKTSSAGIKYTGIKNFTINGEYGQNESKIVKKFAPLLSSPEENPKAWMGKILYKGAKGDKVGSFGTWVGYRNADFGFDSCDLTTLDSGNQSIFANLDNVKGAEFGVEYTVFHNGIFTVQYNDMKLKDDWGGLLKNDVKNFFAQLVYSF